MEDRNNIYTITVKISGKILTSNSNLNVGIEDSEGITFFALNLLTSFNSTKIEYTIFLQVSVASAV
jgi:hypothetical protein